MVWPLTSEPLKPSSRTARVSSAAAVLGSCMGRVANPPKRSGCRAMRSARKSLFSRARRKATAASGSPCTPGPVCDRIA
ncbi:Uncharacterised protein [Bordetella pertussis]|nr:Uncharacterised protein [Bordetella pertussis]CFP57935.1 Uncharacterised protein [Bordetella pertussis]